MRDDQRPKSKDQRPKTIETIETRTPKVQKHVFFIKSQRKFCGHKSEVEPITEKIFFRFFVVFVTHLRIEILSLINPKTFLDVFVIFNYEILKETGPKCS